MAQPLIWSQESLEDIEEIAEYISRDSRFYAQQVVEKFFQLAENLAEQPLIGRIVPEVGSENIREQFVYSYRVIYQIQPQQIEIIAILHGKRLLEAVENRIPTNS